MKDGKTMKVMEFENSEIVILDIAEQAREVLAKEYTLIIKDAKAIPMIFNAYIKAIINQDCIEGKLNMQEIAKQARKLLCEEHNITLVNHMIIPTIACVYHKKLVDSLGFKESTVNINDYFETSK